MKSHRPATKAHAAGQGAGTVPVHRIEAFSDAVFAFAVTLLVVSLEVPRSAHELFATMRGFLAFGICFALLISFWVEHNRFFQRYPLNDGRTLLLNTLLLFVLLLYVYPLKFLFSALVDGLVWHLDDGRIGSLAEFRELMVVYGAGFVAINVIFALMKANAARLHLRLGLGPADLLRLRGSALRSWAGAAVAVASIAIATFTADQGIFSGCIYGLIGPVNWWLARRYGRAAAALGHGAPEH
jgi:uncharacterized membrane protein